MSPELLMSLDEYSRALTVSLTVSPSLIVRAKQGSSGLFKCLGGVYKGWGVYSEQGSHIRRDQPQDGTAQAKDTAHRRRENCDGQANGRNQDRTADDRHD